MVLGGVQLSTVPDPVEIDMDAYLAGGVGKRSF
jgi:hypothetical protein